MGHLHATNSDRSAAAITAGYSVRRMRPEDAQRVADVHVRVWREAYESLMPSEYLAALDQEQFTQQWRDRVTDATTPRGMHLVGMNPSGDLVAMGSAGPTRDPDAPTIWELWAINVLAIAHGSGLADLMMNVLVDDDSCCLWVLRGNSRASAFYVRHGFVADGHTKSHAPTGTTELRMVRPASK